jgi:hypothetical protein
MRSEIGPLIEGIVAEPCVGMGDLAEFITSAKTGKLLTNDIDLNFPADTHEDARTMKLSADWVVTNPPFVHAMEILKNMYPQVNKGIVLFLRVTFQEPTLDRGDWLREHPPTKVLHLPRISFTGDGSTDSAHGCWFFWDKTGLFTTETPNETITRSMMREYNDYALRYSRRTRPL